MLRILGKSTFNILAITWLATAELIGYGVRYFAISKEQCALCQLPLEFVPSIEAFSTGTLHSDSMFFVALYFLFTWPICLAFLVRNVGVTDQRDRYSDKKNGALFVFLFGVGFYMSFIFVDNSTVPVVGTFSRQYYYYLYFAVLVCWASYLTLVFSLFNILNQFDLTTVKEMNND